MKKTRKSGVLLLQNPALFVLYHEDRKFLRLMDSTSFASAFENLRLRLMGISQHIVGNRDDAADAVQDAFCRLWTRREAMASSDALTGASIVTVRNLSVDKVRHRNALPVTAIENVEVPTETSCEEREEAYDEVMEMVARQLTQVQQAVLKLRELNGWEFDEIAQHLETTPEAVRMQLSRARCKIRECYRNRNL